MIELGRKQILEVVKETDFGIYVGNEKESILLPKKYVTEEMKIGTEIEVFVYKDSMDRLIATTKEPLIKLDELAVLRVVEVNKMGAFLDWGLEKDLLLPFKEQTKKLDKFDECLVALYIDKSSRLCATMRIYNYLSDEAEYRKDDKVTGTVYEINEEIGAFVAVDNKYYGLIPKSELYSKVKVTDVVTARVTKVREDGKLDLSVREKAYIQMDEDARIILKVIDEFDGVLPFTDKANPAVIKRELNMSKNAFKRGVGRLLKEGKIEITEKAIRKIN